MSLQIDSLECSHGRITIFLNGELDSTTSPEFEDYLCVNVTPKTTIVALDLKDLTYISSAGLRVFAKLRRQMTEQSGHTVFANLSPQVAKVFDIVKAIPINEVFSNMDELDTYLKNIQEGV